MIILQGPSIVMYEADFDKNFIIERIGYKHFKSKIVNFDHFNILFRRLVSAYYISIYKIRLKIIYRKKFLTPPTFTRVFMITEID